MGHTRVFSWAHLLVRDLRTRYGINPIYVYRWGAKAQGMREKTGNGHDVSAELEHFIEDLKAVVRDGQALLKAGVSTVKERAVAGAQGTNRIVRERPYQTVGIAFGLGLVVGLILSHSMKGQAESESD